MDRDAETSPEELLADDWLADNVAEVDADWPEASGVSDEAV